MIPLKNSVTCRKQVTQISLSLLIVVCLSLAIAASPLSLFHIPDAGMRQPQPSNWFPAPENFIIEPAQVARGSSHTITIISTDCEHKKFEGLDKVIIKADLDDLKSRKGIELTPSKNEECKFTAELTITNAAMFGVVAINIHYLKDGAQASDSINITVIKEEPLPPGPLVPGLPPQVDIMWSVVPQKIVKDNFGMRIGKVFYCLEVVIGNDTGYDLQIATVAFQLGPTGKNATLVAEASEKVSTILVTTQKQTLDQRLKNIPAECNEKGKTLTSAEDFESYMKCVSDKTSEAVKSVAASQAVIAASLQNQRDLLATLPPNSPGARIPSASYRMTRGSIEHGQFWNLRNLFVNSLRALGPLLTGFTPYFHVLNHQRNYAEAINIISNPFEKGFELIVPDETVPQLQRLDEQSLRDGMIIPNNRQIRTRTFIPKDVLRLDKKYRDDPLVVMMSLGKLHIIGDLIAYRNRISVTAGASGEVTPPPTVNPSNQVFTLDGDKDQILSITGTNLEGAVVISPDPNIDNFGNPSTTKNTLSVSFRVEDTASPGGHTLNVQTKSGTVNIPITLRLPAPKLDSTSRTFTGDPALTTVLPKEETTQLTKFTGRFLQGARLIPLDSNPLTAKVVETDPAGKFIRVTITVPAGLVPTVSQVSSGFKFGVVNSDNMDLPPTVPPERQLTVTLSKRGVPMIGAESSGKLKVSFENGAAPPKANPTAPTSVTLLVDGENLNNLVADRPIVQKTGEKQQFALDAKSVESISDKRVRVKLTVPMGTPNGEYHFQLVNEAGPSSEFVLNVDRQDSVAPSSFEQSLIIADKGNGTVTLTGTNLDGAQVLITPQGWTIDIDKGKSTPFQLVLSITAPTTFTDGTLTFKVANMNGDTDTDRPPATVSLHVAHPPAPTITKFLVGDTEGNTGKVGDTVIISGQNFKGASGVKFGNVDAVLNSGDITDDKITVKVPSGLTPSADGVDVTVTAQNGKSQAKKFIVIQ